MASKKSKKKLSVKKESLRKLDADRLDNVAGGAYLRTARCDGGVYTVECPNTTGCWTM